MLWMAVHKNGADVVISTHKTLGRCKRSGVPHDHEKGVYGWS
jgi:hypothetical protein